MITYNIITFKKYLNKVSEVFYGYRTYSGNKTDKCTYDHQKLAMGQIPGFPIQEFMQQ